MKIIMRKEEKERKTYRGENLPSGSPKIDLAKYKIYKLRVKL